MSVPRDWLVPQVNCCLRPKKAKRKQSEIYSGIRDTIIKAHCVQRVKDHPCAGQITITAKHITMNCKLCGDVRQILTNSEAGRARAG